MSYSQTSLIAIVIKTYGLALDDRQVEAVLATWLQTYDSAWIIKALVESLYRGRYKLISVDNILKDWQRIGKPRYNFTPEYEREIFQKIPSCEDRSDWESLLVASADKSASVASVDAGNVESVGTDSYYIFMPVERAVASSTQNLNPEESAPFHYHHHSVAVARIPTPQADVGLDATAIVMPDRILTANYPTSRAIPAELLLGKPQFSRDLTEPARQAVRPAKRRLFNTLKAIVDPNNHYDAAAEEPVVLLSRSIGQMY